MGCLYLITSPSGKEYVGITSQPLKDRWRGHRSAANTRSQDGALQKAIRKYGAKAMICRALVLADDYEYLKELERKAIAAFGTKVPNGYNMTDGGDGVLGAVITDDGRTRRRAAQQKSYADPVRRARHKESQSTPELRALRADAQRRRMADEGLRDQLSVKLKAAFARPEVKEKLKARKTCPKKDDGLTKWQRYRAKDIDAYRSKKREYAKTPEQREQRRLYAKKWRDAQKAKRSA